MHSGHLCGKRNHMPQTLPDARHSAFDILGSVLDRKRPLDEALDAHPALARLTGSDRAFCRNLVTTTLRRLGQIDDLIDGCLHKPLSGRARPVRHILRLGACQLSFLETPPHAAVDTSVRLARAKRLDAYTRLVNAVLRGLDRRGKELRDGQDAPRLNTPDWLWKSWRAAYGEPRCRKIATAHLADPPLDVTVKESADVWARRLDATPLPTGSLRLRPKGPVGDLPGFAQGAWWVQDAAAALPVRFLGAVEGRHVVDLCAAPGGKTAQLTAAGARVTAVDVSENRMARLRGNLHRLGLDAELVRADAIEWRPAEPADAVLLDAPCSATGTIRRHPDVPWLKEPGDVAALARRQRRLLAAALRMVRSGGFVLYCTCSLQPEEGRAVIDEVLSAGCGFAPAPIGQEEAAGFTDFLTAEGDLRTLPCGLAEHGGMDGFFISRLRRR